MYCSDSDYESDGSVDICSGKCLIEDCLTENCLDSICPHGGVHGHCFRKLTSDWGYCRPGKFRSCQIGKRTVQDIAISHLLQKKYSDKEIDDYEYDHNMIIPSIQKVKITFYYLT